MSVQAIADILKSRWGLERGAKLLHVGSGAGHMVAALRALGFDATGVECSREASLATPAELAKHNFCCDFAPLAVRGRRVRRRDRDGTLPIGAGQGGGRDRGTSSRDEAWRASRIRDDGPHDRGHRTLQLARGCAGPLLPLGLVRKVLCGRIRARAIRTPAAVCAARTRILASWGSVGEGAGDRRRAQPVVRRLGKPPLLRLRTGVEARLASGSRQAPAADAKDRMIRSSSRLG